MSTTDMNVEMREGEGGAAETSHAADTRKAVPTTSGSSTSLDAHPTDADSPLARRTTTTSIAHLSLGDVKAVEVQIRDLAVTVDTSPSIWEPSTYPDLWSSKLSKKPTGGGPPTTTTKTLLHSVDASLQPGTLTAILGGSGSGKTTLLNTIAERMHSTRLARGGTTTFNGVAEGVHSVRHAYVMQQDILLPTLTVRETLRYAASLRLPRTVVGREERERVVEEVILELGLKDCADTRIGSSQHRG